MNAAPPLEPSRERTLRWGLFLTLIGLYLLTASRERPWSDGELLFQVAEALVERHGVEILWSTPPYSYPGPDDGIYAYFPILPSLALVPSVWLLELLGPAWRLVSIALVAQLPSVVLAAFGCTLFYSLCRRAGAGPRAALTCALLLGVSTSLWVYARRPYSESLQVVVFLGYLLALLRLRDDSRRNNALLVGLMAGLLINTELAFGLSVLSGVGFVAIELRRRGEAVGSALAWAACGLLPLVALALAYNRARWGSPFITGYEQIWAFPPEHPLWGVIGLAFSPGKSIFLYSPVLVPALFCWPRLWRANPRLVGLLATVTVPPMLAVASLQTWNGGWCWGPRVWLFATPVVLLPLSLWLEGTLARPRGRARAWRLALLAVFAASGFVVQGLGNSFYWDHHVRLAKQVQQSWLGQPNRSGAILEPIERRTCDPCTEDMYGVIWLPAFQPIAGHAWMLRHIPSESPATVALADAPWRRYTTISVDLSGTYRRARFDWWATTWLETFPERKPVGIGLIVLFAAVFATGVWVTRRGLRRARETAPPQA